MIKKFESKIIEKLLQKPCPVSIPRSGDRGKAVNCYSISLYAGDIPLLLVDEVTRHGFGGMYFESDRFKSKVCIPFSLTYGVTVRIEHYYGLYTHTYNSVIDYCLHEWTGFYKVQTFCAWAKHAIPQFVFNKVPLQLPSRMKILEKIIAKQSVAPNKAFSSLDIMSYVYGLRWYLHPQKTEVRQKMDLYLDSFVASGELLKFASDYKITGQAVATLEKYQIEVSRAKSDRINQKMIIVLTIILAIFAGLQAKIIETSYKINLDRVIDWVLSLI
ncbi:hypothetical protein ACPV4W_22640 [Vibrio diabolicus]|uniref:hypothetical protein n=1 Tax=Vibrio harveyi group TaxID=717610 RepID=UPI002806F945|nr:hypothetical protein [Vibrio parahaemolyticus]ELA8171978.1 hypothetical protein [Vibrio parahaemolyticus]ELX4144411.1 hypothetical protein [Vibrio vulnificus]MDS1791914.1 hypothetical protein [Vibrio parahaemolyticus]